MIFLSPNALVGQKEMKPYCYQIEHKYYVYYVTGTFSLNSKYT